jgi:multidrug efflux pump
LSQILTLYTTPVVYLYLDRFGLAARRRWDRLFPARAAPGHATPEAAE